MPSEPVPETRVSTLLREKLGVLVSQQHLTLPQACAIVQCVEVVWDDSMPDDVVEVLKPLMSPVGVYTPT